MKNSNGKPLTKTKQRSLVESEKKIYEAEQRFKESFFDIGAGLAEIRNWELWKQVGCKSWNDYCKSGRLDISRQHADRLIAAHKIRGSIADAPTGATWSHQAVRALVDLMDSRVGDRINQNEVARISKKVVKRVEGGEPLTAKLVKEVAKKDLYGNNNRAKRSWDELRAQRHKDEAELAQKHGAMLGERLPLWDLCIAGGGYGLSDAERYRERLGCETRSLERKTFAEIKAIDPPKPFINLFADDVRSWHQRLARLEIEKYVNRND